MAVVYACKSTAWHQQLPKSKSQQGRRGTCSLSPPCEAVVLADEQTVCYQVCSGTFTCTCKKGTTAGKLLLAPAPGYKAAGDACLHKICHHQGCRQALQTLKGPGRTSTVSSTSSPRMSVKPALWGWVVSVVGRVPRKLVTSAPSCRSCFKSMRGSVKVCWYLRAS